jgi:diguanylate cyclase (GGDEF)-like protein/PAS domain S-box-containing protein
MKHTGRQRFAKPYMWLIVAVGAPICLFSAYHLPFGSLDLRFLLLALITVAVGSRIAVQIPRISGQVTVADTLIFLTLLLYGGEAAILLAALEGICSSLRISRKPITILFNSGMLALSTFLTVWTLRLCFGTIEELPHSTYSASFIVAVCVMALVQYITNSVLAAVCQACKSDLPIWPTWSKYYLWSSVTYVAGASAAGIIAKLTGTIGFYAVLVTVPIVAVVYVTYLTYLRNIDTAERHVAQLSHHIAEQERIRKALEESEEHYRSAYEHFQSAFDQAAGMALVAPDGCWLKVNRSLSDILGYSEEELLSGSIQDVVHADDLGATLINIDKLVKKKISTCQLEQRYIHKRGHTVWVLLSISLVRATQKESSHLIFQLQDITERKRAEERLVHDAFHDGLTGLPNRALFMDHLKHAVERARRNKYHRFTVLFLDLDRFKVINDSLGHLVGDQLLIGIARRLETCIRSIDTVARLGGDEFTILLEDLKDPGEAIRIVERIQRELSVPFKLSRQEVFTTVSIGIAPSTTGYDRAEDILRDADTAMYRAKSLGKSRHEVFDKGMHAHAMNLLHIETDLRRAVERQELRLHYQPIVSLDTQRIIGFEALVRWQHSERGLISPLDFIPIAEETGLIVPIGQWVLTEACRQMREWQQQTPAQPPPFISVNLSSKQFTQPDLLEQIKRALQETGLDPRSLKLEITESVLMENMEAVTDTLQQLRALGVEMSIDDFGTGYSSLSYLHRLPIDTLKVDRSFVSQLSRNDENREIVRTIVTLAQSLGLKVVAEGIETTEQMAQLQMLKCEGGQGYLFSRAVEAEAASELLTRNLLEQLSITYSEEFLPEQVELVSDSFSM